MAQRRPASHATRTPARRQLTRRQLAVVVVLLVALAATLFGRSSYNLWLRQRAISQLRAGAITQAQRSLERAAQGGSRDGQVHLLLAFCHRQLRQLEPWQRALGAAQAQGAPSSEIQREERLYRIQTGDWPAGAEAELQTLAAGAATDYDVPATFVTGCLESNRLAMAKRILDAWSGVSAPHAHVSFVSGLYWQKLGDGPRARSELEQALRLEPRHELARVTLAELLEEDNQLPAALDQFLALGRLAPTCEKAAVGAARVLRKLGHVERAESVLTPFAQRAAAVSPSVQAELGRIALDKGDLDRARQAFEAADVASSWDPHILISAMQLQGILGNAQEAEQLFQRVAVVGNSVTRTGDLQIRLQVDPDDQQAAAEMAAVRRELNEKLNTSSHSSAAPLADLTEPRRLYLLHCAECHGVDGAGNGRSARHLFPYPRNLRHERSRLVSTRNGVPTLEDTLSVLRLGIPGTSMPAYDDLPESELRQLAEEVHALRRDGLRELYRQEMAYFDEPVEEEEVEQYVRQMSTPGEVITVPAIGPPDAATLERGKAVFIQQACHSCHGEDGRGLADQAWFDERGFPVRTRDLAREPLKGSQDARAIFLRIAAGMPGTPHPANTTLDEQQLVDVVQYCLSLSREPKLQFTDFERAKRAGGRDYVEQLEIPTRH